MIKLGFWVVSLSDAPILLCIISGTDVSELTGVTLLAVFGSLLGGGLLLFGFLLARIRQSAF